MNEEELQAKMLAFIETKDGYFFEEWYATPRDFAATILADFAQHLGLEMVIPDYVPQLNESTARSTIAMMRSMASHIPINPLHNMASDQMESLLNEVLKHRSKK